MTEQVNNDSYQILVVNIKYGREISSKIKNKPDVTILDVPENILKHKHNKNMFYDLIETFAYNTVSRKYGSEVGYCQVYLPLGS